MASKVSFLFVKMLRFDGFAYDFFWRSENVSFILVENAKSKFKNVTYLIIRGNCQENKPHTFHTSLAVEIYHLVSYSLYIKNYDANWI